MQPVRLRSLFTAKAGKEGPCRYRMTLADRERIREGRMDAPSAEAPKQRSWAVLIALALIAACLVALWLHRGS